ncbi:MAG: hypothetical protein IJ087_21625 [Eggerthellaceae bacterium]|nr:hypothetical protein [Eggerthellaceae bacterium]
MATGKTLSVRFPDEESYETVRIILEYESASRKRKLGRALLELVLEAADVESYPVEVQQRLSEITATATRKSIDRFLELTSKGFGER